MGDWRGGKVEGAAKINANRCLCHGGAQPALLTLSVAVSSQRQPWGHTKCDVLLLQPVPSQPRFVCLKYPWTFHQVFLFPAFNALLSRAFLTLERLPSPLAKERNQCHFFFFFFFFFLTPVARISKIMLIGVRVDILLLLPILEEKL